MSDLDKLAATVADIAAAVAAIQNQVDAVCSAVLAVNEIWQDGYRYGSTGESARPSAAKREPGKRDHLRLV